MKQVLILLALFFSSQLWAQPLSSKQKFTHADTVRGTYNEYRDWWDLQHYDLSIRPDAPSRRINGQNKVTFTVVKSDRQKLQLDLQKPMQIDSVLYNGEKLSSVRYEQAYIISFPKPFAINDKVSIDVYYSGIPKVAVNPPWDGGLIWTKDDLGNEWISVACQGLGASVWWPCKDHQQDEPDRGVNISITVPANVIAVSNGNLYQELPGDNFNTYQWKVTAPINSYDITMNIGKYTHFDDTYKGLKGNLNMQFWFLEQHKENAKKHLLAESKDMLKSFEYWFGPYPFYEDSYKLIETPFLGMEHQSGIAYGNKFMKGYLGRDLSGSGWGSKWDYILVHESGHEWFGNSITAKDIADMWIQEGFTTYSEVLFVESRYGKKAADAYAQGLRRNIMNDKPIIGAYGVNKEGSGDMYFKGVQMIHTYRQIVNDDEKFRAMLHEMNKRFYHKTTTTQEVEALMQEYTDVKLDGFFNTYLRTTLVPNLKCVVVPADEEYALMLEFSNVATGFQIPVNLTINGKVYRITVGWDTVHKVMIPLGASDKANLTLDPNYYITLQRF